MGLVLGIDVSTTATKAVLVDESGAVVAASASPSTATPCRGPLWSEQDPELWWDGAVAADPRRCWPRPARRARRSTAVGLTGQMHGVVLLDARGRRCSGRRSSGTTSGPPPSATRSGRRSGRSG